MWVFGYGSLMWDGWETERGCLRRTTAELHGYARAFNKLSVRNWGSRECPGPTLNLIVADSVCRGVAFEFPEGLRADVLAYLVKREGKNFAFDECPITLEGYTGTTAIVPLYQGPNVIASTDASEIATMALSAKGMSGSCANYIKGVADHLRELQIDDPVVTEVCTALVKSHQ